MIITDYNEEVDRILPIKKIRYYTARRPVQKTPLLKQIPTRRSLTSREPSLRREMLQEKLRRGQTQQWTKRKKRGNSVRVAKVSS